MSTELEQARIIAERVARRMAGGESTSSTSVLSPDVSSELASVRATLSDLERKLAQLEAKVKSKPDDFQNGVLDQRTAATRSDRPVPLTHSPWLAGVNATTAHPSQERFGVEEAAVSELVDFFEKEKTCTVEPGGKPCDHCAMCSSRGF
jgi:hypothetical protein